MRSRVSARALRGGWLMIGKPPARRKTQQGEMPAIKPAASPQQEASGRRHVQKRVWALAVPAIGEQLLALCVGLSDTFLTGHLRTDAIRQLGYGRADAVAAVGVGTTTVWVVLTLFLAVGVGATALVARAVRKIKHSAEKGLRRALSWGCWRVCSWQHSRYPWCMPSRMCWA
jgi:Na+-driven multidrug efflux pump